MKRFRRRSTRPARSTSDVRLERLESRELLSSNFNTDLIPSLLFRRVPGPTPVVATTHPIGDGPRTLSFLDNDGKVISGQTEAGDKYTITVHGPGVAIVTDTSPNDGLLNSEIDTIQLIGTDINQTFVTAQVSSSNRVFTDGTIGFNRLIADDGVASIVLNGFVLRETGPEPSGTPRIALLGGVRTLAFRGIEAVVDTAVDPTPIDVIIGDPSTPLTVRPDIRIDHIFNTSFDGSTGLIPDQPRTDPTVRILVNGQVRNLDLISSTAAPAPADVTADISPVSFTGRTSLRTFGVEGLKVSGSARNFTVSRAEQPFSGGFSGVDRIGHAFFGGTADAVALDATGGRIGALQFLRGLGNPNGTSESLLPSGIPLGRRGFPASGLSGGVVAANEIGESRFGPANLIRQIPPDPMAIQARGNGTIDFRTRPGNALTNVSIASAGSIGETTIVGNSRNSLIASGFDYQSFVQGLDPVREPSHIGPFTQRGDLIDSVVAASFRSNDGIFGDANDQAGRGSIRGNLFGNLFLSRQDLVDPGTPVDPGQVRGAGFFARQLIGNLPNIGGDRPQRPKRIDSVLVRV